MSVCTLTWSDEETLELVTSAGECTREAADLVMRGNIIISPAAADDLEWLLKVDTHVPKGWILRCIAHGKYLVAASISGKVGLLRYSMFWGTIPFKDLIYIVPSFRRLGIGSLLFETWREAMCSRGASLLMSSSMSDEPEPQAWHRRNGFEAAGTLTFGSLQPTPEVSFVRSV